MKFRTLLASFVAASVCVGGVAMFIPSAQAQPPAGAAAVKKKQDKKDDKQADAVAAKIGQKAPDFTLTDLDGKTVKLSEVGKDKIVVLEWFNPKCPFILKHHEKNPTFNNLYKEFESKGVVFLAINSGAPGKEGAAKEDNVNGKKDFKLPYPILMDSDGTVGHTYGAKTTPHCFVINKQGVLVYAGAIDNNSSPDTLGDKNYVKAALDETIAGKPVTTPESKAYGCGVKYK